MALNRSPSLHEIPEVKMIYTIKKEIKRFAATRSCVLHSLTITNITKTLIHQNVF